MTKAELTELVTNLRAVLASVQAERDGYQRELEVVRGEVAKLSRTIEMREDAIGELEQENRALERDVEELCDERDGLFTEVNDLKEDRFDELEQANADRERLLEICGLTEQEWDFKRGGIDVAIGRLHATVR